MVIVWATSFPRLQAPVTGAGLQDESRPRRPRDGGWEHGLAETMTNAEILYLNLRG